MSTGVFCVGMVERPQTWQWWPPQQKPQHLDSLGFVLFFSLIWCVSTLFCMTLHDHLWFLNDLSWIHVHLYASRYVSMRFLLCLYPWCAQSVCLQSFGNLRKNAPLECWSMNLVYLGEFCYSQLGAPNQGACSTLATSEETCPWNFGTWLSLIWAICISFYKVLLDSSWL